MAHGDTHITRNFDTGDMMVTNELWDLQNGEVHFLPIFGVVTLPANSIILSPDGRAYYKPPYDPEPPTITLEPTP